MTSELKMMNRTTALELEILAKCSTTKARACRMLLPHGPVPLPMFMPVGTQATLKGIEEWQMQHLNCSIFLNNTYHLGLRPGQAVLDTLGGAHKFQSSQRNILTDSGGFQMVSLLELAHITERGVEFRSPHDNSPMLLTPEKSIDLQNSIGSDIMMQLDDVISSTISGPRVEEAMWRSIRWLDRCIIANKHPEYQNLFCIIQGGLDKKLREICCREMVKRNTTGIAIGGLSGGEEKSSTFEIVDICTSLLPDGKPRYLMGVGYPEDMVIAVALGVDMFDCVYPTRTARFGNALTRNGPINLKNREYLYEFRPLDDSCRCPVCASSNMSLTRSYIAHVIGKETVGARLLSLHNLYFQLDLMNKIHEAIKEDRYPQFIRNFFYDWYSGDKARYPSWAIDALKLVNVNLMQ